MEGLSHEHLTFDDVIIIAVFFFRVYLMLAVSSFSAVGAVLSFVSISTICSNVYVSCCSVGIYLHLKKGKKIVPLILTPKASASCSAKFVGACLFNSGRIR